MLMLDVWCAVCYIAKNTDRTFNQKAGHKHRSECRCDGLEDYEV
jgi:hypothetical protein